MSEHQPIQWIRDLYSDCDEKTIVEAEDNFIALIDYFANLDIQKIDKLIESFDRK